MGCTCVQSWEQAPGGVQYNPNQLAYIWIQAGGPPQAAAIAAAIAYYHESSGWTTATCVNGGPGCGCNGCVDRGLWQIDSVHGAGSSYDVMTNARTAVALYQASGWQPWGGDAAAVMAAGQDKGITPQAVPLNGTGAAAGTTQPSTTTGATSTTGQPTTTSAGQCSPLQWVSSPIQCSAQQTDTWVANYLQTTILAMLNPLIQIVAGVLGIAAGGTIMLLGIVLIVRQSQAGRTVTDAGLMAVAPEATSTTQYQRAGEEGVTTVEQSRRRAVRVGAYQPRPGRVTTTVTYPEGDRRRQGPRPRQTQTSPPAVPDQLRGAAGEYPTYEERRRQRGQGPAPGRAA